MGCSSTHRVCPTGVLGNTSGISANTYAYTANTATQLSRRTFLSGSALVVAFSLSSRAFGQLAGGGEGSAGPAVVAPTLPGSLKSSPMLDSWIRIDADGKVTVFTGKVASLEGGQ